MNKNVCKLNINNLVATDGFEFSGSGLVNDIFKESGYIVPKNDDYFTEYSKINRLKIISNFTGSAGVAIILKNKNYLFTDGRYTIQSQLESGKDFKIMSYEKILNCNIFKNLTLGIDPKLFTYDQIKKYFLKNNKIKYIDNNLIDEIKYDDLSEFITDTDTHKGEVMWVPDCFYTEEHRAYTLVEAQKTQDSIQRLRRVVPSKIWIDYSSRRVHLHHACACCYERARGTCWIHACLVVGHGVHSVMPILRVTINR